MALQSQVWSPATPMPMAESSLYRQRLEVIAEKLRLQEEIRAARGELEEEKLRVERLKRKSLRERWLMDGAPEGSEGPEDPASQDPQSPEGQAQARIRNLEDSLFTLQSQLQLLQSASTGAQHKPSGRPTWRRQGHRPLSQPAVEAGTTGQTDLKRASLPAESGTSPESPSEPRDEVVGVPPLRRVPGPAGGSLEANGPCPRPSPPPEQQSQGMTASEVRVDEAKEEGMVKVVWKGLRATEDCAMGPTGPELEAKVEEMVLEAIGDRPEADHPELPSWVKTDRGIVEVVWEGVGGKDSNDAEAMGEVGTGLEAVQTSSPRLQEGLEGAGSGEVERAPRGSPDGYGQGGSAREEGSFIWVERVTLSEEWEELLVEGLEGPRVPGREGGDESLLGAEREGGEETWEVERRQAEESMGTGKNGSEEKARAQWEGVEMLLVVERKGSEEPLKPERRGKEKVETDPEGGEEPLSAESKEAEEPLRAERERSEEPLRVEQSGGEAKLEAEKEVEEPLGIESKEVEGSLRAEKERGEEKLSVEEKEVEEPLVVEKKDEERLEAIEEPLGTDRKEGEGSLMVERTRDEEPLEGEKKEDEESLKAEKTGSEEPLEAEKTQGIKEDVSPEEERESGGGKECEAEEVSDVEVPLGAKEEPQPEEEGPQPQEKQEGSLEEEAVKPQPPAEGQDPSGDATPLLAETPAPEQPAECQPLLPVERPKANPSARPMPTYAPAQQPQPPAPPEGEEASGPKQKTCQCCAVM
ncbi:paralemmin-3 isoform X1 [Rhinolophus sinicus]|uniref:paralemmin-3 isoform X1 n=2 Tax=Rhinolophus sinicus TaxID=89399 RepID=UPI003D79A877